MSWCSMGLNRGYLYLMTGLFGALISPYSLCIEIIVNKVSLLQDINGGIKGHVFDGG